MKKLLTLITVLLLIASVNSNTFAQVVQSWVSNYNYSGANSVQLMIFTNHFQRNIAKHGSNAYVGGTTMLTSTSGSEDILIVKYANNSSVPLWTYTYNTGANFLDYLVDIKTDAAGNVYALGYINYISGGSGSDLVVIKLNSSGVVQWIETYSEPSADVSPKALAIDNSGNVIVTGYFVNVSGYGLTLKYNSSGVLQWNRTYSAASTEEQCFFDIALDQSGNIFVGGFSKLTSNNTKYRRTLLVKYNTNGSLQWGVNGSWHDYWISSGIVKLAYDAVFNRVVGLATLNSNIVLMNYFGNGNLDWSVTSNNSTASDLITDNSGNIFITGTSFNVGSTRNDFMTRKYNPSGVLLWNRTYNSGAGAEDFSNALDLDDCGDVYVTGRIQSTLTSTNYDFYTARYNGTNGSLVWDRKILVNNFSEGGRDLAVLGIDNLYVTGSFFNSSTNSDFKTIKYSSSTNEVCGGGGSSDLPINNSQSGIEFSNDEILKVYPNPSNQIVNIFIASTEGFEVEITDILGKVIMKDFINSSKLSFDFANYTKGVYFINVKNESKNYTQKAIIQ